MNRSEIEAQLVARAWRDPEFLDALKSDPYPIIEHETHKYFPYFKIPENCKVTVLEESEDHLVLVFPMQPETVSEGQLSDEHLAMITGGLFPFHVSPPGVSF